MSKRRSMYFKAAGKSTNLIRHIAASKWKKPRLNIGKLGAASPVRHIVKDGVPVEQK